jgi:hypothetical protein
MFITFGIHLMKNVQKMYSLFVWFILKLRSNKKKVTMVSKHPLVQISLYPWLNGQYMLPYYTKTVFFFLNWMPKRGQNYSPPWLYKSREGSFPQLFRPWSGISEHRTADIIWSSCQSGFLVVCASQSSVFWVFVIFCHSKYLSFCHVIPVYLYHILLVK